MKQYINLLKGIGLSEKQSLIYLTLLETSELSTSDIVKHTNLHRMEVYRMLPYLIDIGIVLTSTKGKRNFYSAASPQIIEQEYSKIETQNKRSINDLIEKFSFKDKKPKVVYQEGKKGVTYVFNDIINSLNKGDVFYRISSENNVDKANTYLPSDYRTRRDKKELERYVIMSSKSAETKIPRLERDLVTIPKEIDEFEQNISITIYGNKVAYIDFSTETSIVIENKEIASFQTQLFKILYKTLKMQKK